MNENKCVSCHKQTVAVKGDVCGLCIHRLNQGETGKEKHIELGWWVFVTVCLLMIALGFGTTLYLLRSPR